VIGDWQLENLSSCPKQDVRLLYNLYSIVKYQLGRVPREGKGPPFHNNANPVPSYGKLKE
jgi:hypothetical protein